MKEIIILVCWHKETDPEKIYAFEENMKSFNDYNPDIDIVTVLNSFSNRQQAWLSTDLAIFRWFRENGGNLCAERYLLIEWDCWCDCDLREYFGRVWDCNLVVPNIKYPERDDWFWFSTINELPIAKRPYAVGVSPMCGILISKSAMEAIAEEILKPEYENPKLNSELRLGTIATALKIDPVVNPVCGRPLGWKGVSRFDSKYRGLHHPRKKII